MLYLTAHAKRGEFMDLGWSGQWCSEVQISPHLAMLPTIAFIPSSRWIRCFPFRMAFFSVCSLCDNPLLISAIGRACSSYLITSPKSSSILWCYQTGSDAFHARSQAWTSRGNWNFTGPVSRAFCYPQGKSGSFISALLISSFSLISLGSTVFNVPQGRGLEYFYFNYYRQGRGGGRKA